jgi:hypothetical protein
VRSIPTLDPAKGFTHDSAKGAHVFKAREVTKTRTQKVQEPLTLAPATDKHPAQVYTGHQRCSCGHNSGTGVVELDYAR